MPDGAFKIVEAQYGDKPMSKENISKEMIVKIFKDGYWIGAFFGSPAKPFNGSCGGTYKIKDGKYIETVNFYSWDSTAVGRIYTFNYALTGNQYVQEGYMDSEKYKHLFIKEKYEKTVPSEPLKNTFLEGAWKMQSGEWDDTRLGEGPYKNVEAIKIYAYPRFAFAYYNEKTNQFVGAGGGTYQFDGEKLTEHVEYFSWGKPEFPIADFNVTITNGLYTQSGWQNGLKETWKKLH